VVNLGKTRNGYVSQENTGHDELGQSRSRKKGCCGDNKGKKEEEKCVKFWYARGCVKAEVG
jgi:hypothetical protein